MKHRLKEIRRDFGLTQTDMAEIMGLGLRGYQFIEQGERELQLKYVSIAAKHLRLPESAFFISTHSEAQTRTQVGRIFVIGAVEAGVWREAEEWAPDERDALPIIEEDFQHCYALKIGGDSMNLHYQEGDYAIVCPLEHYPNRLTSGEHVIVRRIAKDGKVEATIKELVIRDGKAELWPRSTNPKYAAPINIHWPYEDPQKSGTELVEICGVVVSSYKRRRKI